MKKWVDSVENAVGERFPIKGHWQEDNDELENRMNDCSHVWITPEDSWTRCALCGQSHTQQQEQALLANLAQRKLEASAELERKTIVQMGNDLVDRDREISELKEALDKSENGFGGRQYLIERIKILETLITELADALAKYIHEPNPDVGLIQKARETGK